MQAFQACVLTLSALLKFELDRRDNDEQIVIVFKSMVRPPALAEIASDPAV